MTDCATKTIEITLPKDTSDLLEQFAAARKGSPFNNTVSSAIRNGIECALAFYPSLAPELPRPDERSLAMRLKTMHPESSSLVSQLTSATAENIKLTTAADAMAEALKWYMPRIERCNVPSQMLRAGEDGLAAYRALRMKE